MFPIVEHNIKELKIVAKLLFPVWFEDGDYNFDEITKEKHEYDFLEYQDAQGNVLARHTMSPV